MYGFVDTNTNSLSIIASKFQHDENSLRNNSLEVSIKSAFNSSFLLVNDLVPESSWKNKYADFENMILSN